MKSRNEKYAYGICKRMKKVARKAQNPNERVKVFMTAAGILNSMRIGGFLEKEEYNRLYNDMTEFSRTIA